MKQNLIANLLVLILMLSGCTSLSVNQRLDAAIACQQVEGANCEVEWAAYNTGVEAQVRREKRDARGCPRGYYEFCNRGTCSCATNSTSIVW